jgi:ribosome-associated protein
MSQRNFAATDFSSELQFSTSRSSGPGGQNVNKVNSKVTLKFNIPSSTILSQEEKEILLRRLATRLTTEGVLILTAQDKRSQLDNKESVLQKFEQVLKKAFEKKKVRKATKPSKKAVKKRLTDKKQHGEKKQWRKNIE